MLNYRINEPIEFDLCEYHYLTKDNDGIRDIKYGNRHNQIDIK